MRLDIRGLDRAAVLAALYNGSRARGMGFLHYSPERMTIEEAAKKIAANPLCVYFDYLNGRVMKIKLHDDFFDTRPYDRDNGPGAAARALTEAGLAAVVVEESAS